MIAVDAQDVDQAIEHLNLLPCDCKDRFDQCPRCGCIGLLTDAPRHEVAVLPWVGVA